MSLAMYLYPPERVAEERFTTGHCVVSEKIAEQRYVAAEIPQSGVHVSVLAIDWFRRTRATSARR
jgi:OmpA-OmpF porin, OOP family